MAFDIGEKDPSVCRIPVILRPSLWPPTSLKYALAVVRQVINYAKDHGTYQGENPCGLLKTVRELYQRLFLFHDAGLGLINLSLRIFYGKPGFIDATFPQYL